MNVSSLMRKIFIETARIADLTKMKTNMTYACIMCIQCM